MSQPNHVVDRSVKKCLEIIKLQNNEIDRLLEKFNRLNFHTMSQDIRIDHLEKNMQAQMLKMIKAYLHDANNEKELRELGVLPPPDSDPALAVQQPIVLSEEIVKMGDDDTLQLTTSPTQVPQFVRLLQKVDPRDRQTLVDLQKHLDNTGKQPHTSVFPMYKVGGPTEDTAGTFFLHVGQGLSRQIATISRSQLFGEGEGEEPKEDVTRTLGIFELHVRRTAGIKARGEAFARRVLPRYVIYLGEMHEEHHLSDSPRVDPLSMHYHVVMDVTRPDKPLWVIWKYDEKQKGLKQKGRDRVSFVQPETEKPGIPLYQGCPPAKVDLLKLLGGVRDWNVLAMFEDGSGPGELMHEVQFYCQPCFTTPIPDEMDRCLKWSWHAAPEGGN